MSKTAAYVGVGAIGLAGAIVLAVLSGANEDGGPSSDPETTQIAVATQAPSEPRSAASDEADTASSEEPQPTPVAVPSFDIVRADPGGPVLVAGSAHPEGRVEILVDGTLEAETMAAGDGKFVALFNLEGADRPRVVSLRLTIGDTIVLSDDEVIIAPMPGAPALAEGAPSEKNHRAPSEADPVALADASIASSDASDETAPRIVTDDEAPTDEGGTDGAVPRALTDGTEMKIPVAEGRSPELPSSTVAVTDLGDTDQSLTPPASDITPRAVPEPEAESTSPDGLTTADAEAGPSAPSSTGALPEQRTTADPAQPEEPAGGPAVMLSSARGIEVLQTAPLAPGDVALDSISYDAAGEVLLSGRGDQRNFVRVYLDNAPLTTTEIGESGRWRVVLPDVDTGTYTLRVDQIDAGGDVVARVESPFLRESPEALAAAATGLAGPVSSITVQPGNTLWAIARDRYGEGLEYVKVFDANRDRIRDPDLIYPGQIFDLPTE